MPYSAAALDQMRAEYGTTARKRDELFLSYIRYNFQIERAREYARHGFLRRLKTVSRCLDNVFRMVPPDRVDLPSIDELTDTTISIQSFVINVFGSIDNLAWLWVLEKNILDEHGQPIQPSWVGLRPVNVLVRNSLSVELRDYLNSLDAWFGLLENYRHALAHRIPLYIPPGAVRERNAEQFQNLERLKNEASVAGDFAEYRRLDDNQDALLEFRPWITHSLNEAEGLVHFHPQMLADFNTVIELGQRMIVELVR